MKQFRRKAAIGIGLAAIAGAAGCQSKSAHPPASPPPPPTAQISSHADAGEHTTLPATQPVDTAQVIASKAAAYSQDMSRMLNERELHDRPLVNGAPTPTPPPPPHATDDGSQVQWTSANEFRLADEATSPASPASPSSSADNRLAESATPAAAKEAPSPAEASSVESSSPEAPSPQAQPIVDASPVQANQVASIAPTHSAAAAAGAVAGGVRPAEAPRGAAAAASSGGDALAAKFARRVKDYPNDIAAQLDYQLLLFLEDEQVPELATLASLPEEDRELVTAVLDGLSNFRNGIRADNNMLLSRKVQPMLQMADRLRAQADLYIPAIALCTKVDGFGSYKVIDPPRFIAGSEHPAIVYCEIANFASQLNDQKLWETRLVQEAVLYTETGLPVWHDASKTITDVCRNRRHDFFMVKLVKFPATLTIGRYLLKVTVVDQQASRVAEATVPIQIVAQ